MRPTSLVLAATLITAFGLIPAAPATAAPAATPCTAGTPVPGDYDGDGGADLMVGVEAMGTAKPTRRLVTPSDGRAPYWLAFSLENTSANADLNGDVCADIVSTTRAGGYHQPMTVLGSTNGLDASTVTHLGLPQGERPEVPGVNIGWPEISAIGIRHHGISQVIVSGVISWGDYAGFPFLDTYTLDAAGRLAGTPVVTELDVLGADDVVLLAGSGATVAIGAPNMYVGGKSFVGGESQAGGVLMFSADANDPSKLSYRTTITQDSRGVPGAAETSDGFGSAVSLRDGRLAIGVRRESIGRAKNTGLVQPILWHEGSSTYTAYRSIQQSTRGVPGSNESGDLFGARLLVTRGLTAAGSYDIAIGAPFENVGRTADAGSVTVANFTKAIYRSYTQNTKGIWGTARKADEFGTSLGALRSSPTTDTLLIGAPYELDKDAQRGYVVRSDGRKLGSSTKWVGLKPPAAAGVTYTRWGYDFAG